MSRYFNKGRIQLLGNFDFLPFSDSGPSTNSILFDYRISVLELQKLYVANIISKLFSGQNSLGYSFTNPIDDYFSIGGTLQNILGPTLSGEASSLVDNRVLEIYGIQQSIVKAVEELTKFKVNNNKLGDDAYNYAVSKFPAVETYIVDPIPSSAFLGNFNTRMHLFAGSIGENVGVSGEDTVDNVYSTTKLLLQLILDTQYAINHYYPIFIGSTNINSGRQDDGSSYILMPGIDDVGDEVSLGNASLIDMLSIKEPILGLYRSRIGEYGYGIGAYGYLGTSDVNGELPENSSDEIINKIDNIPVKQLIEILSKELSISSAMPKYQDVEAPVFERIDTINNGFSMPGDPEASHSINIRLISSNQESILTDLGGSGFFDNTYDAVKKEGSIIDSGDISSVFRIDVDADDDGNTEKQILPFEPIDVVYAGSRFKSGRNGLIKPVFDSGGLLNTVRNDASAIVLDPSYNLISELSPIIDEIIDDNLDFMSDIYDITTDYTRFSDSFGPVLIESTNAVNIFNMMLEQLIPVFECVGNINAGPEIDINDSVTFSDTVSTTATDLDPEDGDPPFTFNGPLISETDDGTGDDTDSSPQATATTQVPTQGIGLGSGGGSGRP
jgi:hypothetical protein